MRIRIPLQIDLIKKLKPIVKKLNSWPHKKQDTTLSMRSLRIDLADIPSFWISFLEKEVTLKFAIRELFINALREVEHDKRGVAFKDAEKVLNEH